MKRLLGLFFLLVFLAGAVLGGFGCGKNGNEQGEVDVGGMGEMKDQKQQQIDEWTEE